MKAKMKLDLAKQQIERLDSHFGTLRQHSENHHVAALACQMRGQGNRLQSRAADPTVSRSRIIARS
jgi:hypothetical protein